MDSELELGLLNENNISIKNPSDPPELINARKNLLNSVLNNRKDDINHLIQQSNKDDLQEKILSHKYHEHGNKPILIIACINESVSKDTLNSLCQSIRSHNMPIDCFDKDWYKWEPIHYVARKADPDKLQVLLDNSVSVNSLTTFSENALHVLLEYQQCVKPYNTLLYNGSDSRECLITSTEENNILECAEILIRAGININHSNLWNEVSICIAIRYHYLQIIELLLKIPTIELDNFIEVGFTIRAYLRENYIYQDALPQPIVLYEDAVQILLNYLKSGDDESFVKFNNGDIKFYANSIDGNEAFDSSGNMLQLCFKKGYLEYLQHELYGEELTKNDIMDNLMLNVFCSKGLGQCIEHLLNNGANPNLTYRKFPQTLLEAAAIVGYYPLVAILLYHHACKITADEIFEILPKLYESHHNLRNHESYRKYVLSLLLNKLISLKGDRILSDTELNILDNLLYKLNLERNDDNEDDSDKICQILKLGASLTRANGENKRIIKYIHPKILRLHFDDCVENNLLYYNSIIEDNPTGYFETRALQFLGNSDEKSELLTHPLLIYFIHNKWSRNFYFFYANLLLYFLFLINIYAFTIFSYEIRTINSFTNLSFYLLLTLHFIKECIQLIFVYHLKYFLHPLNYLELMVIISMFINAFHYNEYCAVIAILFSTVIFLTLLGQAPGCAKYSVTIIFRSTKYFFQYAGFYFIQLISFALIFYIIFPFKATSENITENNSTKNDIDTLANNGTSDFTDVFGDLLKSLFYTLILFTGEFSDRVLEPERFPIFGRLIMTIFIFCMTIILNNLLVGLIVADMDEMQKAGKLHKQVKIATFISRMNSIAERLDKFKNIKCIDKYILSPLLIFKKGEHKILDLNKCTLKSVFDNENLTYLKCIRSKKNIAYDSDLLKNVYVLIKKKMFGKKRGKANNLTSDIL